MMRQRLIRAAGVALVLTGMPFARAGEELPRLETSGFQSAIRRQIQQAEATARALPRSAEAAGKLGMVLDAYQQYETAEQCYRRAHMLDRHSFRWAYYLGSVEFHQGRFKQAEETLRESLQLTPDYLPAQLKLAESLLATGNFEESEKVYQEVSKNNPDLAEALYGLGRILASRGDNAGAAESFAKACQIFPQYGAAQYALALAFQKQGKPDAAAPHFRAYQANVTATPPLRDDLMAAVQELNLGAEVHLRRSVELEQQGRLNEAIEEQNLALKADPQNVQANINLISLYARVGNEQKAEQHYQDAVRLNPDRADTYYNYGVLMYMQGKYAESEKAYRQALKINPYYAEAHNNLGFLLEKQGLTDGALAEYRAAIQAQPSYPLAYYHVATIMARQGKYQDAIDSLLKALQPEDEHTPSYLYALAISYAREGDQANAMKYARQARDRATAWHQTQLVSKIDQDFTGLDHDGPQE